MKAFEEYWDCTGLAEHVHYVPDAEKPEQFLVEGINRKEERREGWRAALEWVMSKNHKDAIWIGDDTHNNTYDIILTDDIRQELEN